MKGDTVLVICTGIFLFIVFSGWITLSALSQL